MNKIKPSGPFWMPPENRFDRFNGHWFDASFLEEDLDGAPVWEDPQGICAREIDWEGFLSGVPLPRELCTGSHWSWTGSIRH